MQRALREGDFTQLEKLQREMDAEESERGINHVKPNVDDAIHDMETNSSDTDNAPIDESVESSEGTTDDTPSESDTSIKAGEPQSNPADLEVLGTAAKEEPESDGNDGNPSEVMGDLKTDQSE